MPRAAKASSSRWGPSPGQVLEARIAQRWFWEGHFARRSVNLQRFYDPEPLQVTDLDLLAFEIGPTLKVRTHIGEAKSGTGRSGPKPLDRLIWLSGLRDLIRADSAELTIAARISPRIRELGDAVRVSVQNVEDLERRERQARISEVADLGSQGPSGLSIEREVFETTRHDPELERAFAYLRSDAWLLEPAVSIKRSIAVVSRISRRWIRELDDGEQRAVRWLLAEAITAFSLQATRIAGTSVPIDRSEFAEWMVERLAEGAAPAAAMRTTARAIDDYVTGILRRANVPDHVIVASMGAFAPSAPEYTATLTESCARLAARPEVTKDLPRLVDLVAHERLVRRRDPTDGALARLGLSDRDQSFRLLRVLLAFLRGQAGMPEDIVAAVGTDAGAPSAGLETTDRTGIAEQMQLDVPVERS